MILDLSGLLGLAADSIGGNAEPSAVLRAMSVGPFAGGRCCQPTSANGYLWCQITTFPTESAGSEGPIRALLGSLVGTTAPIRFRLYHQDGGIGVFLGSTDSDTIAFARTLMSPGVSTFPIHRPPPMGGTAAGLIFRLQAELAPAPADDSKGPELLDRLASMWGNWTIDIELVAADAVSIMLTRRSAEEISDRAAQLLRTTTQVSSSTTTTTESAPWLRVLEWLRVVQSHLTDAGATGGWISNIWVSADRIETRRRVQAVIRGALGTVTGRRFVAYDLECGPTDLPPATFLSSHEVANLFRPPTRSVPGLTVRKSPPPHVRPSVTASPICLGTYPNTTVEATIGTEDLEGHAFVAGTTGSGKTTTMHRILTEIWNRHRIPFLVIDPVKDDYSQFARLFDGGLMVLNGASLRNDILQTFPGLDPTTHVTQVAQAFKASFTMPSPTPYVVTQLFDRLALQPGGPQGCDLFDLLSLVDSTISSLGYAPEASANIRAAIRTRLITLLSPARAHRFAWNGADILHGLFDRPVVITLADLVDNEERSFVVLMIALAVWAAARNRTTPRPIEHVLVIEEAHRVIPEIRPDENPETGSAKRASAELLSAMLAEVRSFGEQVIVVDQSPSRVSSEVLRNTNLKLAHRIVQAKDQAAMAAAIGIHPGEADLLGLLERGHAIVSTRTEPLPQLVEVGQAETRSEHATLAIGQSKPPSAPHWPCRCADPTDHFRARAESELAARTMSIFALARYAGTPDEAAVEARARAELQTIADRFHVQVDCLAWAGIRHIVGKFRRVGAVADATRHDEAIHEFMQAWMTAATPTANHTLTRGEAIVLAECAFPRTLRTPLDNMARPGWQTGLVEIRDWLLRQQSDLQPLISRDGIVALLSALVESSANRVGEDQRTVESILVRSRLRGE